MQFALNQEQNLLKDAVDKFVCDRYGDNQRRRYRANPRGYSPENWQTLADMGLLGLPFDTEYGGWGAGPRELMVVLEALGHGFTVEPFLEEVVTAGGVLSAAGTAAQKALWLPRIVAGQAHLALAHAEHAARFNLSYVGLKAGAQGSATVLDGEKTLIPLALGCDQFIVSAREQGAEADPQGIGFYLVAPQAAGIERRDYLLADGSRASAIRFRGVRAGERLAGGFSDFKRAIDTARFAAGAEMLGIMSTLFASTVDRAPSVMESPKATIVRAVPAAATSMPSR